MRDPAPNAERDFEMLRRAIARAQQNIERGGRPFGALLVKDGKSIGEGWNQVMETGDPTAHAEMVAIRMACKAGHAKALADATIYSSAMPCPMCFSALLMLGVTEIVYAADSKKVSAAGFRDEEFWRQFGDPKQVECMNVRQLLADEGEAVLESWRALKP